MFADEGLSTPRVSTHLSEMKRYASRRLQDPSLGPQQLARAHYVSTRYVHKLFAASGTSVSRWIRDQRLDGAARVLQSSPELPISLVASRWGYRNAASFSRAFNERFGCTPSELRSRGDEGGSPPKDPAETDDPQPCG